MQISFSLLLLMWARNFVTRVPSTLVVLTLAVTANAQIANVSRLAANSGSSRWRSTNTAEMEDIIDPEYPGTAVQRMNDIHDRVRSLTYEDLNGEWENVRRRLLWAGGLLDLPNNRPGQGYTGHAFNDFNHCDLTAMKMQHADHDNLGNVPGIAYNNPLGNGIRIASIQEDMGEGGSWSTCQIGSNQNPPNDVAHVQFQSRIAFKLVWTPPTFDSFVLVDDAGTLLASGTPRGNLPRFAERQANYQVVVGGKYAKEAEQMGKRLAEESAER